MQLWTTVAVVSFTALVYFASRFHAARTDFRRLQWEGLVSFLASFEMNHH